MPHWSSPSSPSPASRYPSESFAGSLSSGTEMPGGTPTRDLPPMGIWSTGLPLIPCPECGDVVEEYIPGLGGSITGYPSSRRRNETGMPGGCSFFKTQEEYEAILRDRGLLGPGATPEQERRGYLAQALSEPVGTPEIVAAVEDLKHEMVASKLAMAQLKTCIEGFNKLGFGDMVEKARENKHAIAQLKTDIEDFKGKFGVGDKFQKVAKTDSPRCAKAIVKWLFVASAVVLLFCIVIGMSV